MNDYSHLRQLMSNTDAAPCVSLIIPLKHTIPERAQNAILLRELSKEALQQIAQSHSPQAREVEKRLNHILQNIDVNQLSCQGVAIIANAHHEEVIELEGACTAYMSVGNVFALSDIIQGTQNKMRCWVLWVGKKHARLFSYDSHRLSEILTPTRDTSGQPLQGFPLNIVDPEDQVIESVGKGDRGDSYLNEEIKHFFQIIDSELYKVITSHEALPVILCGTPEYITMFTKTTQHHRAIFLHIPHYYSAHQSTEQLKMNVVAALHSYHSKREQQLLGDFEDALNSNRQACGALRAWETASTGRIHMLLLEPGLSEFASVNPDNPANLHLAEYKSDGNAQRISDLLIAETLRHGGDVRIVQSGSLNACKGIGAILRY